jgi:alanyl-tRNA synthetase
MELACGERAFRLLREIFDQNRQVSQMFSAKIGETGAAARKASQALEAAKFQITGLQRRLFAGIAESYVNCDAILHFEEGLEPALVRELADKLADRAKTWVAVFSGVDGEGYNFCMASRQEDLRGLSKSMTQTLGGRGGGKPNFQQGKVAASRKEIEEFFRK